jgi:hypothetical protein
MIARAAQGLALQKGNALIVFDDQHGFANVIAHFAFSGETPLILNGQ